LLVENRDRDRSERLRRSCYLGTRRSVEPVGTAAGRRGTPLVDLAAPRTADQEAAAAHNSPVVGSGKTMVLRPPVAEDSWQHPELLASSLPPLSSLRQFSSCQTKACFLFLSFY